MAITITALAYDPALAHTGKSHNAATQKSRVLIDCVGHRSETEKQQIATAAILKKLRQQHKPEDPDSAKADKIDKWIGNLRQDFVGAAALQHG